MSEVNKCNVCGKFKPWEELKGLAGDSDEIGNYDQWFECVDCMCGNDLREFSKQKIKEIAALKAQLSEFQKGIPIEKAKTGEELLLFIKRSDGRVEKDVAVFTTIGGREHWLANDGASYTEDEIICFRRIPLPTAVKEDT